MNAPPFRYVRPADQGAALDAGKAPDALFLAGGTNVVDYVRLGVLRPAVVVDVSRLPLAAIDIGLEGLALGALATNADVAHHPGVRQGWPVLSEALLSGASPQLRNLATVGGNLLQRTRCAYFRDVSNLACNKRKNDSGCAAMDGWTRMHAVLGTSDRCIAVNPSDMSVALAALDAIVHVRGSGGERAIPLVDFHNVPGGRPDIETALAPGELVVRVTVPASAHARRSRYVKVRDRASYAFALASCAACVDVDPGGTIRAARLALGGVATKPWRALEAERVLVGKKPSADLLRAAAELAMKDARPRRDNGFKVELGKRTVVRALELVTRPS